MSLLEDLQTTLAEMDIPVETGIFSDKAPEQYLVIIPLADTFDLHADNAPGVDVQEARLSLFATGSYTTAKNKLIHTQEPEPEAADGTVKETYDYY